MGEIDVVGESIGFGTWIDENGWIIDTEDFNLWLNLNTMECSRTETLYIKFLEHKKLLNGYAKNNKKWKHYLE